MRIIFDSEEYLQVFNCRTCNKEVDLAMEDHDYMWEDWLLEKFCSKKCRDKYYMSAPREY